MTLHLPIWKVLSSILMYLHLWPPTLVYYQINARVNILQIWALVLSVTHGKHTPWPSTALLQPNSKSISGTHPQKDGY